MPVFTKESLERLRQRVDLVDTLGSYMDLKRTGATYKGLCPFHDEKTPSFVVQRGDTQYHCFGCGAHGDAIKFLIDHLNLNFTEAVELLAERFNVILDVAQEHKTSQDVFEKKKMREILQAAARFYHFYLLKTEDGVEALKYLYSRGIGEEFVKTFYLGLAPQDPNILFKFLESRGFNAHLIELCGLSKNKRDFFHQRIMFPIRDFRGAVIGFSGRKYKEETFGGKYVNSPETPLFKKSQVLYGLNYSRRRIAKEKEVLIVEGQIDALRLIEAGLNFTVAGQGTAFTQEGVQALMQLGVEKVYLGFDGDEAGKEAVVKVGNFFQTKGIGVFVLKFDDGEDPDSLIKQKGITRFVQLLEEAQPYLQFLVDYWGQKWSIRTPEGKNQLVKELIAKIESWEDPLFVHESLRFLARLVSIPESLLLKIAKRLQKTSTPTKVTSSLKQETKMKDHLEIALLRTIFFSQEEDRIHSAAYIRKYLQSQDFNMKGARLLYQLYLQSFNNNESCDPLTLLAKQPEAEIQEILDELSQKRLPFQFADKYLEETLKRVLDRSWMGACDRLKQKIQRGMCSEEESFDLAQQYSLLRKTPPVIESYKEFKRHQ